MRFNARICAALNAAEKGMMKLKKAFAVLIALALIVGFGSCKKLADEQAAVASPVPAAEETPAAELPNPIVEVDGPEDFDGLGVIITPHQQADSATYSIIGGTIAQIVFTLDRETFVYRAAMTRDDISGVYELFDALPQSLDLEGGGFKVTVLVRTIDNGRRGALAEWDFDGVKYSFYTQDPTDFESLTDVLLPIIYTDLPFAVCCG
jgi:hypothetical protein